MAIKKYIDIFEKHKLLGADSHEACLAVLTAWQKNNTLTPIKPKKQVKSKDNNLHFIYNVDRQLKNKEKNKELIANTIQQLAAFTKESPQTELLTTLINASKNTAKNVQTASLFNFLIKQTAGSHYQLYLDSVIKPQPAVQQESPTTKDEILLALLKKKKLPTNLFARDSNSPKLPDDISAHVSWIYQNIYRHSKHFAHGIQHTTRSEVYISVFANLMRKYNDPDALNLMSEDIKLVEIASLLHDSAREGDEEDLWDHESAIFAYYYFRQVLGLDKEKAKMVAEAIANKDISPLGYFEIFEDKDGSVIGKRTQKIPPNKNIYQRLLQNADCLDIQRARDHFDAEYLDFYQTIAKDNEAAFDDMAQLITEARSLIALQGDARNDTKAEVKKLYENEYAHQETIADIDQQNYPILKQLGQRLLSPPQLSQLKLVDSTPYKPDSPLTEDNLQAAMREGKVLSRAIMDAAVLARPKRQETRGKLELRKSMREKGVPTRKNRKTKEHNPARSVSMVSHGSAVFSDAGFLNVNFKTNEILSVNPVDIDSGLGKKGHIQSQKRIPSDQIEKELKDHKRKLKMGGSSRKWKVNNITLPMVALHGEILQNISHYDAIYFTNEPTFVGSKIRKKGESTSRFSPILQALFLQKEYEKQYDLTLQEYIATFGDAQGRKKHRERFGDNKTLPIFEYSRYHAQAREIKNTELTDEVVLKIWKLMCTDYMLRAIEHSWVNLETMSFDEIKSLSMTDDVHSDDKNAPADSNYSSELQSKINANIENERNLILESHKQKILDKITHNKETIVSRYIYYELKKNSKLIAPLKQQAISELNTILDTDIFQGKNIFNVFEYKYDTIFIFDNVLCLLLLNIANIFSLSEQLEKIKEQAIALARKSTLLSITNSLDYFGDLNENFKRYILFSEKFGISENLQKDINDYIDQALDIYDKNSLTSDLEYFSNHLNNFKRFMVNHKLLTPSQEDRIKVISEKSERSVTLSKRMKKVFEDAYSQVDSASDENSTTLLELNTFVKEYVNVAFSLSLEDLNSIITHHEHLPSKDARQKSVDNIAIRVLQNNVLEIYKRELSYSYPKNKIYSLGSQTISEKYPLTIFENKEHLLFLQKYQQPVLNKLPEIIEKAKTAVIAQYEMRLLAKLRSGETNVYQSDTYKYLISMPPALLTFTSDLEGMVQAQVSTEKDKHRLLDLFKLAKHYGFTQTLTLLSKQFEEHAELILEELTKPSTHLSPTDHGNRLNLITSLSSIMDALDPAKNYQQKIENITKILFLELANDIIAQRHNPPPLGLLHSYINLLEKTGPLSAESVELVKSVFKSIAHQKYFEDEKYQISIYSYTLLVDFIKVDFKQHLLEVLNTKIERISPKKVTSFLDTITKLFPLNQDNLNLYIALLNKFDCDTKSIVDISSWLDEVSEALPTLIHEPNLSKRWLHRDEVPEDTILHSFMKEKVKKMYGDILQDKQMTTSFEFDEKTTSDAAVEAIRKLNLSLNRLALFEFLDANHPLVKLYNQCLHQIASLPHLQTQLPERVKKAILVIHQKVPLQQERQADIDVLFNEPTSPSSQPKI